MQTLHAFTRKVAAFQLAGLCDGRQFQAIHNRRKLVDEAGGVQRFLAAQRERREDGAYSRMAFLDLMLDMVGEQRQQSLPTNKK